MDCVWQNDFGNGSEYIVVDKGLGVDNKREKKIMVSPMEKLWLNATKVAPAEVLHVSYSCSYAGFLLKETRWEIKVNQ